MSRPNKRRYVSPAPKTTEFRPVGVAPEELRRLVLPLDGLEALRLTDLVGLEQAEAAQHMGVSRQTFGRILAAARRRFPRPWSAAWLCGSRPRRASRSRRTQPRRSRTFAALTRVAVSAHAASLDAAVAPRFGRAPGFLIVDPKTMDFDYASNGADTDRQSGRGADAAALIARAGVTVLLTGFVGAKAARALAQAGIRVVDGLGALTAREAVECLVRGEITPISPDDVAMSPPTRRLTKEI